MREKRNFFDPKEYQIKRGQVPKYDIHNAILLFDIVGFSADMVNEVMINIVGNIHKAMWDTLESTYYWAEKTENSNNNDLLLIPTGDGYGIALNNIHKDETILDIAEKLYKRFIKEQLKFRMGIAKGRNVLAIDLNDNLNIFGYGIVMATRVCSVAKEGQILVHSHLADSLLQQKRISELKKIDTPYEVKHGVSFHCYNYYRENEFGIES